jgi:hypothetical protein
MEQASVEVRAALYDAQRYLLDEIPPLTVSDAIETLMTQPPELLMRQIRSWSVEQSRLQDVTMSECLFHALRKIREVGALDLVDRSRLNEYLGKLVSLSMQACPAGERETLKANLIALRDSRPMRAAAVTGIRSAATAPAPAASSGADLLNRGARRLSLVIERLTKNLRPAPSVAAAGAATSTEAPPTAVPDAPLAQLMTMAAATAASRQELDDYLASLRPVSGARESDNLFTLLADGIPAWDLATPEGMPLPPSPSAEAMRKIFKLTPDTLETTSRLRELTKAAVEQFNRGSLSAAVQMFDLADSIAAEKKVDPSTLARMAAGAADGLTPESLKRYSADRSKLPLLRNALARFPGLTPDGLLQDLRGEQKPERRRALLGMLEAWGARARDAALAQLEAELDRPPDEVDTYYLRNLIFLLHRIGRDEKAGPTKELELLERASERGQSIYVIKEAITAIGQIPDEASVKLLTMRLAETEAALLRKETSIYPAGEMQKVLDRAAAALGRIGTPSALLTIARHGMKANPLLGDTRARLASLAQHDLSFDENTVDVLVKAIRDELPGKLLGRFVPLRPPPVSLIEALSSTRSETVESLFAEIAAKFSDQDVGRAAAAALAAGRREAKSRETAAATLTGDLEFFGMPSLLQSLADAQATGIVSLVSRESRRTAGKILVVGGKFADAQAAHLRGPAALYLLLERPVTGSFSFVPHPAESVPVRDEPKEVMPLLFEGIRRHDELKQAELVAPDDLRLQAGGAKPSPDPQETDPALVRTIWVAATSGKPVGEIEKEIPADPYRVRRLIARWIEEGALQPV